MNYSQDMAKRLPTISRRDFIKAGITLMGAAAIGLPGCNQPVMEEENKITIGMLADVHYADRAMRNNRYYRDSLAKVRQCIAEFNLARIDFAIELGDFVDQGESLEAELSYLEQIEQEYANFRGERHYVLGNHDVATFSKEQFFSNCDAKQNYYSFDSGSFHNIILDACYNKDLSDYKAGNFDWTQTYIHPDEQEWLRYDLQETGKKTIVFVHQRLDDEEDAHGVKNAPDVRNILEESGKVLAVFQGHDHRGAYKPINGIHYYTLPAVVEGAGLENNAYAVVEIRIDGSITISGYGKLQSQELPALVG